MKIRTYTYKKLLKITLIFISLFLILFIISNLLNSNEKYIQSVSDNNFKDSNIRKEINNIKDANNLTNNNNDIVNKINYILSDISIYIISENFSKEERIFLNEIEKLSRQSLKEYTLHNKEIDILRSYAYALILEINYYKLSSKEEKKIISEILNKNYFCIAPSYDLMRDYSKVEEYNLNTLNYKYLYATENISKLKDEIKYFEKERKNSIKTYLFINNLKFRSQEYEEKNKDLCNKRELRDALLIITLIILFISVCKYGKSSIVKTVFMKIIYYTLITSYIIFFIFLVYFTIRYFHNDYVLIITGIISAISFIITHLDPMYKIILEVIKWIIKLLF